ncbi:prepilin-type N-terminal cleavage/methylation domain-containing protein, partial [Ruminiclostridium cellobioparum]|uniref:prepilin-type N-terminal cleavage/methylation domain-containing protein n=1 Tax=Ruminiclostridium cellobioparum TaxID=29355 RepID=UPI0035E42DC7
MKTSNNKGFTLVEMLIVLAIICIILPLVFQLYTYGQETFAYNSRLIAQQYTVTNVMSHI